MPMFGSKHFSNPSHGKFMSGNHDESMHEDMGAGGNTASVGKAHSVSMHRSTGGGFHTHSHMEDGSQEHMDHGSYDEAEQHMRGHMSDTDNDMSSEPDQDQDDQQPKPMKLHNVNRMSSGGF